MLRLLQSEVDEALKSQAGDDRAAKLSIATGRLAAPYITSCVEKIRVKYPGIQVRIFPVRNDFFGESITVSGLITGQDLVGQLSGEELGSRLLIPCNMLRQGENVFLDDLTVEELEQKLGVSVDVVDEPGEDFVKAVTGREKAAVHRRRTMYEQTDSSNCGTPECG